jgi:hypothetical protein
MSSKYGLKWFPSAKCKIFFGNTVLYPSVGTASSFSNSLGSNSYFPSAIMYSMSNVDFYICYWSGNNLQCMHSFVKPPHCSYSKRYETKTSKEANTLFNVVGIGSNTFTPLLAAMIHSTCRRGRERERRSYYRCVSRQGVGAEQFFFWKAGVCCLFLCVCPLCMNFEGCLDSKQ